MSLISFFNSYELFPAFICSNNVRNLVNNLFGIKAFNPVSVFFFFGGFDFTLPAIVSSGPSFTSLPTSSDGIVGKSSSSKSKVKFSGLFRTFIFFFLSSEGLSY